MTTPAGLWNQPEALLGGMLSNCAAFRTFVGAATPAAALLRVYYEGMAEPANVQTGEYTLAELIALRPCAIVSAPRQNGWRASRVAEETFRTSGKLVISFFRSVATTAHGMPTAGDVTTFKNLVGEILEDLLELPWQWPNLATRELYAIDGPYWGDAETVQDEGVWLGVDFILEW